MFVDPWNYQNSVLHIQYCYAPNKQLLKRRITVYRLSSFSCSLLAFNYIFLISIWRTFFSSFDCIRYTTGIQTNRWYQFFHTHFEMINSTNVVKIFAEQASKSLSSVASTTSTVTNRECEVAELLCGTLESITNSHCYFTEVETTLDYELDEDTDEDKELCK